MGIYIKETLKMIRGTDQEFANLKVAPSIKVNGEMTSQMVRVFFTAAKMKLLSAALKMV